MSSVGARLAEAQDEPNPPIRIGAILHSPSDEAEETARVLAERLGGEIQVEVEIDLSPSHLTDFRGKPELQDFAKRLLDRASSAEEPTSPNSVLVVGHQPLLGWLAHTLTGTAWPVGRSELLCIEKKAGSRGRLRWVLSPTDAELVAQLRDKIRSKMDVAKLLTGFITVGLGFLLGALVDSDTVSDLGDRLWAAYVATGMFFAAIGLYLATMYAYDSLLMPSRFWGEAPGNMERRPLWIVARPPSSVQWILYQNMVRIWSCLFTPATIAVLAGLGFLQFAVLSVNAPWEYFDSVVGIVSVVLVVLVVLGYRGVFRRHTGPWVGSED